MKSIIHILLLVILLCGHAYGQSDSSYFWISGKVRINFYGNIQISKEPTYITLKDLDGNYVNYNSENPPANDSGLFKIDSLKPGIYKLSVLCFSTGKIDTIIAISDKPLDNLYFLFNVNCNNWDSIKAEKDIITGKTKLLLFGSVAPLYIADQDIFEKKYNIKYFELGDCIDDSFECLISYNKRMFKYLNEKYGNEWRKEIRTDVIGLKDSK